MTSAQTRVPMQPLVRPRGVFAFILFVVVLILPH
jgi:hypothetical protein